MARKDAIEVGGTVVELPPNTMFCVAGTELARVSGKIGSVEKWMGNRQRTIQDLIAFKILSTTVDGKLQKVWDGDKTQTPAIYKVLAAGQAPEDAFVRWCVEDITNPASGTWQDESLIKARQDLRLFLLFEIKGK